MSRIPGFLVLLVSALGLRAAGEVAVGIVGAGPAGLSAALELRRRGYGNVTVLERAGTAGGKSRTLRLFDDESNRTVLVEAGQAFLFPSPVLDQCIREAGLDGTATVDYPPVQFKKTDLTDPMNVLLGKNPYPLSLWSKVCGLASLPKVIKGIRDVGLLVDGDEASQAAPIREHRLGAYMRALVVPRFAASNASPDLLTDGRLAFVYLQKYCAYFHRFPLWRKLANVYPRLAAGNGAVWERLADSLDVRLGCDVRRVEVGGDKIAVRTSGGEVLLFDRLIWACDPRGYKKCLAICPDRADDWQMQEYSSRVRAMFSKVRGYYRAVIHAKIGSGLPRPIFWFLCDEFRRWDVPSMVASAGDSKFYNFYTWIRKPPASDEAAAVLTAKLQRSVERMGESMGFKVDEFCGVHYWDWFPHFSSEDIQDGVFGALEQMQGQHGVYFSGELLTAPGVSHVVEQSHRLVSSHFAPRPVVKPVPPGPGRHADITRILDGKLDYDAYSRKDVGVDVDRLYVAPACHPEWAAEPEYDAMRFAYRQLVETYGADALAAYHARMKPEAAVATGGARRALNLVKTLASLLLTTVVPFLKLVLPTGGLRVTHRLGVGCAATLSIAPNPRLPFRHSAFLTKPGSYKSLVRFAQSSYHDNSALDVKSLSLKVLENDEGPVSETDADASLVAGRPVLDLVMQTCPASVIYSLRFWMLQIVPFAAMRGDPARLRASWKRFAHAFWPGTPRLASRGLASFADNAVYAKSRFHLEDDDGKTWVVTFRALPASVEDENHPDPSLWMGKEDLSVLSERNQRYPTDDRPADYLITELKERLASSSSADGADAPQLPDGETGEPAISGEADAEGPFIKPRKPSPVAFRLQVQCRPLEAHHTTTSEEVYHVMKPWPASVFPWHTVGELRVTGLIEAEDSDLLAFRVGRLPRGLTIPRSYHWNDLTSPLATRRVAEGWAGALRRLVLSRTISKGRNPYAGLARKGGSITNFQRVRLPRGASGKDPDSAVPPSEQADEGGGGDGEDQDEGGKKKPGRAEKGRVVMVEQ